PAQGVDAAARAGAAPGGGRDVVRGAGVRRARGGAAPHGRRVGVGAAAGAGGGARAARRERAGGRGGGRVGERGGARGADGPRRARPLRHGRERVGVDRRRDRAAGRTARRGGRLVPDVGVGG